MRMLSVSLLLIAVMALTGAAEDQGATTCPGGWTKYCSRCFIYVPTRRTWAESERNCLSLGGNLASINSAQEYHRVQDMIRKLAKGFPRTWLGGHDATQEGVWLWSDGEQFSYTNWHHGQPDNGGRGQHCLTMNYGGVKRWDDEYCHGKLPSVCAMDL
ncbi:ladderlectin-like [Polymixia lowei]